jgi:RND family efflux transporter MFP subunit
MNSNQFAALLLCAAACLGPRGARAQDATSPPKTVNLQRCQVHVMNRVLLSVERDGIIQAVSVREGDEIAADHELVRLRDEIARTQLELAEARAGNRVSIEYARVAADVAKTSYDAALELQQQDAISALQLRQRRLEYERGLKMIEQAEFDLKIFELEAATALADLNAHGLTAPFSGTVTRIFKREGESARNGEPVIELVNTEKLQVEGYGHLQDLWTMSAGAPVEVQLDAPELERLGITDRVFTGKLILIDSVVQPVTGMVRVIAEVTNEDQILRDGMKVRMAIDRTAAEDDDAPPRAAKAATTRRE